MSGAMDRMEEAPATAREPRETSLTMAGRELMRNRIVAQCEAAEMATRRPGMGNDRNDPAWLESCDWRLKLGAASALKLKGAPQLMGAPEIRAALESSDEAAQRLIRRTLAASSADSECDKEETRVRKLLCSDDWRLRRGALEALQRQTPPPSELTSAVAELCVRDECLEVRIAAVCVLRQAAAEEVALALVASLNGATEREPLAQDSLRAAEDLLLELSGGANDALGMVPNSAYFADLVQKARAKEEETTRWQQEQQEKEQQLQAQQNELQKLQLQWLDLLPEKQVIEMEQMQQAQQASMARCQEAQALKRRARRGRRDFLASAADSRLQSEPGSKRHGLHDYWVEQSAARLKEANEMRLRSPEELLESSPKLLEWIAEQHSDGISMHLRRVAVELVGKLGPLAGPEHHTALNLALTAPDAQLRRLAVQALERLRSVNSAAEIAKLLADSDSTVRKAAGTALAEIGSSAAGHAAQQLCSIDAETRRAAERTLLAFKVSDGEPSCKEGLLRLPALLPHLEPLLDSELAETRSATASVIHRLRKQAEHAEPACGMSDMSATTPEAVLALLSVLNDPDKEVRIAAMRKLSAESPLSLSPSSASLLAQSLADSSETVRKLAVDVVGALSSSSAAAAGDVLEELLQHKLQSVRRAAAAAMDRLGMEPVGRHLALLADEDATLRCNASEALSKPEVLQKLSDRELASLLALSIDPHWAVRRAVAKCLFALSPDLLKRHYNHALLLAADSDWRVMHCAQKAVSVEVKAGRALRA